MRKRRAIVDSARPEIARLVTELPEARTEGPLDAEDIRAWREAANEHATRNAGFAFQGYVRRRLDSMQAYVARATIAWSLVHDNSNVSEGRDMRALTSEKIENVIGTDAGDFVQAYAAGITLMTGLITGNPIRVAISSLGANGFGADALGSALGIWIYDTIHGC